MEPRAKLPQCPRHPGSRVWRDGVYETRRGRRPRYRCVPDGHDRPHRFVDRDEAPHRYSFTAAEIAAALVEVGRGTSYREAARRARAHADVRESADGNTVAGWVDLLAPAIFARYAAERWPELVVLDNVAFRHSRREAFEVFAALEPLARGRSRIVALEAVPGAPVGGAQPLWERFLRSRPGVPQRLVCSPGAQVLGAVAAVWPPGSERAPTVLVSHVHLSRQLLEQLREEGVGTDERFYRAAARALDGRAEWASFLALPAPRRLRGVEDWLREHADRITRQLEHAGLDAVTSPALLEEKLVRLRERLEPRRGNLRNLERTNRLLLLTQLDLDGRADERAYARVILDVLAEPKRREA
jgi:hypothetical protein